MYMTHLNSDEGFLITSHHVTRHSSASRGLPSACFKFIPIWWFVGFFRIYWLTCFKIWIKHEEIPQHLLTTWLYDQLPLIMLNKLSRSTIRNSGAGSINFSNQLCDNSTAVAYNQIMKSHLFRIRNVKSNLPSARARLKFVIISNKRWI